MRSAVLAALALCAANGCVTNRHPLANDGVVQIVVPGGPLFAADVLDDQGLPVMPRQLPFQKVVQLRMTQGNAPDRGAFVDLGINPPEALQLIPVDGDPSCEELAGAFRCTADKDGYANFIIRSMSTFSGEAAIEVVGRQSADKTLTISPAGLPPGSSNLQLIIEGVAGSRLQATYAKLTCTTKTDQKYDKWEKARVRHATVRAAPPPGDSSSIENAPVTVSSLTPEMFLTHNKGCAKIPPSDDCCSGTRNTSLRVRLNKVGDVVDADQFYLCFSDVGTPTAGLTASSGGQTTQTQLQVDADPRLLRVHTVPSELTVNTGVQQKALEVAAYDSDLNRVGFDVEVTSSDKLVLALDKITVKLLGKDQGDADVDVFAVAVGPGDAFLTVRPALHDKPACDSETIAVLTP